MLEARFNAFKIPESNFLVFEATVKTCREGCQPAYCTSGTGRSEPSFGRKKRSINTTEIEDENTTAIALGENEVVVNATKIYIPEEDKNESPEYPEYVREMIEVKWYYLAKGVLLNVNHFLGVRITRRTSTGSS